MIIIHVILGDLHNPGYLTMHTNYD